MTVHDVRGGAGQAAIFVRPDEEDVAPGVDAHAYRGAEAHEVVERIELAAGQRQRLRLEIGAIVRVAAATDLHDDVDDPARRGICEKIVDRLRGREAVAHGPQRLPATS